MTVSLIEMGAQNGSLESAITKKCLIWTSYPHKVLKRLYFLIRPQILVGNW